MHTLYFLGIIFVLGAITAWLSPKLLLPQVVGYLLLGLLIGPEALALIPQSFVDNSNFVIDLCLAVIAVLLGADLKISDIKVLGKQILYITFFQATSTFIIVSVGFYFLFPFLNIPFIDAFVISLLFGGLAAATAPASTISIVHELKAKGKFTTTLLGVVALDDALALIFFALAVTISLAVGGSGSLGLHSFLHTLLLLFYSTVLGVVGAFLSKFLDTLFPKNKGMGTIATLGMVFLIYSLNVLWSLEPLFSTLVMGAVMNNVIKDFDLVHEEIDNHLQDIIFMLFFILSAMHLQISMLVSLPWVLVAYVLLRFLGKLSGAYLGAKYSHAPKDVQHFLGLALIPQAGLAIGLALSLQAKSGFELISLFILNVIIATTVIHELVGPLLSRWALKHVKEDHV